MAEELKRPVDTHELKCWPVYFALIRAGVKNYELRKDDRGFECGDTVQLREWNPETETYTGCFERREIVHILRDCPAFGLAKGFVILSLSEPW